MRDQLSLRLEPDVPTLPNLPVTLRPMLARPLPEPFDSTAHLFEPSWGGLRALAFVGPAESAGAGDVRLIDGDGRDLTAALPELAGLAVRVDARSAVLDGELVVVDADRPRRRRASSSAASPASAGRPVAFLAFDLLHLDGRSLLSAAARPAARAASPGPAAGRRGRRGARDRGRGPGALRRGRGPGDRRHHGPPAIEPVPAGRPEPAVAVTSADRGRGSRAAWPGRCEPPAAGSDDRPMV